MPKSFEAIVESISHFPQEPGCYLMKDHSGVIFYIGKANHLRDRVQNYFSGKDSRAFVAWLSEILGDIETIVVRNETEALLLERNLIQQHKPRYNILLKDDKKPILLRLKTIQPGPKAPLHQRYPRLEIIRRAEQDGSHYFGPYPSASSIRLTLRLINKLFQLRTCNDHVINNRARPCIQYQIGRCRAPCVQEVPSYAEESDHVAQFLKGNAHLVKSRLKQRMWQAAKEHHYEVAARLRDQYKALDATLKSQLVHDVQRQSNQDVFGIARSGSSLQIAQLIFRQGQLLGNQNHAFQHQEFPTEDLLSSFLSQLYAKQDVSSIPKEILVPIPLADVPSLTKAISQQKGSSVRLQTPQAGVKKTLVDMANQNAHQALFTMLQQQDAHQAALQALAQRLGLPQPPKVMECFDISLFQGSDAVGSKVCFVNGIPEKSMYRRFHIKTVDGTNDFGMLYEVITRRLKRGITQNHLPNLLLVDGGKGQLSAALAACNDLGISVSKEGMFVAAIAKARSKKQTEERLFLPNVKEPILLKKGSSERHLIERIRNEAHRFAITFHRQKRKKRTLPSSKHPSTL